MRSFNVGGGLGARGAGLSPSLCHHLSSEPHIWVLFFPGSERAAKKGLKIFTLLLTTRFDEKEDQPLCKLCVQARINIRWYLITRKGNKNIYIQNKDFERVKRPISQSRYNPLRPRSSIPVMGEVFGLIHSSSFVGLLNLVCASLVSSRAELAWPAS